MGGGELGKNSSGPPPKWSGEAPEKLDRKAIKKKYLGLESKEKKKKKNHAEHSVLLTGGGNREN